ncbi:MAG: isoprenylcysteine carboxylmethyltransferase family protein [Gemmatimonadota bacterium]|nr:isoprenylcysteine carboxylmethyltransferase family protein [Gemmatimonadota bacterium]
MDIRAAVFAARSYTPIPLLIAVLIMAEPGPMTFISGGLLMLIGESIRLWAVGYAGSATRTRHVGAPALITNGPYGRVRNPLYVGNFVLSLGLCVMAWAWMPYMIGIFVTAFGIQYGLIVSLEEESLRKTFGAQYEAYLASVPRFLPRFTEYTAGKPAPYDFGAALRSERRTFQSTAVVAAAIAVRWYWG